VSPPPSDSARRAYRGWIKRLRARLHADSLARADSLLRAGVGRQPPGSAPAADAAFADRVSALARRALDAPLADYLSRVRASFTPTNRAYATTRAALGFLEPLYLVLVGLFILFSGLSAWMRDVAERVGRRAYVRVLVYVALFLAAEFVLCFPLAFYGGFALERQYGLSTQRFGGWLADQAKDVLVALVVLGVVPLVQLAYVPIRRFARAWWLVLGLAALPVLTAAALLQPLVVDPLFNRFTPLEDRRLEGRIVEVARRAGIPARRVFEADRSRQTVAYNAYVSGFGPSQRVVIWDTTLRGMAPDEILFVVGHEAGHYRLGHIWLGIVLGTLLGCVLLGLCAALAPGALRRWSVRWGIAGLHDIASLPLLLTTLTLFSFLAQPAVNAVSRSIEHDADTFGLEVTHANDAAARAFLDLAARNRADPDPPRIVELFEYDHPPLLERVRFALLYRPWEVGRPNRLAPPWR
jgi:Zn-dependent protease with chaperone function